MPIMEYDKVMKMLTVRLPASLIAKIEVEVRGRGLSRS